MNLKSTLQGTLYKTVLSCLFVATGTLSFGQTTIQMQKAGGVWVVPCKVNGLGLNFIFDTGASDVSISLTEAVFMIKNGYLLEEDIGDRQYFINASGNITEGTQIILRQIEFAGLRLQNVEATVVNNIDAPLLFGQSAISELGEIRADFTNGVLTILKGQSQDNFKAVTIGNQIWMVENLNVDTFRNGNPIPEAKTDEGWKKAAEERKPAWCYYKNDLKNGKKYGKLYNWYTVNDPRGLCPQGWHIPSDKDWTELIDYLGTKSIAGGKMKEANLDHWVSPNKDATNESGFTGLPGGNRYIYGNFVYIGNYGTWWSSSEGNLEEAWTRALVYPNGVVGRGCTNKGYGFSVRCLRD